MRPAALDDPLCPGDLIRVGERSRAETVFANLVQRIDQNTTLSLTRVAKDEPSLMELFEGAVYFFSRKPRVLAVDTPYVNAAIEGTEFLVRVEPGRTVITLFQGTIVARNDQGELTLTGGQTLVAEAGEAPRLEVVIRPRDAVTWALYFPAILPALADRSGAAAEALPEPLAGAVAFAARGETAAAFARFEAIPEAERGVDFYLYRAATLLSVGRVDDARADIDRALARDPDESLAYALRAVIAIAQNEREAGLDDARRAVALSPRSAAAKIALSYAEQAHFRIREARDVLEEAVEDEPANALAWARLSEVWLMLGDRRRSRDAAERAEELAPELERVQTVRGFAALAAIDTRRAKAAFERAITIDSASPLPRFGLGLAKIREGDLEEGREDIELAVGLDPDNALLRSYLGKAYFDERTTDPVTYFQQLVENFPNQENTLAAEQYAIGKELDPKDPTPWLYDAIRLQSENRPVEALRELEKSIELNDNRAVYRSRELLDQDQAARGTSLARIYNDLGFEQLGINEATKSLSYDPGNAGAHRFLSDVYATQPRREIARVSELLQAQLLQDININPVQPSLSVTNLNIFTGGGPARPGFNEFTPLFERNQAQLNVSGVVGSDWTRGEEAVVSGIYDKVSLSAGQFYYQSNGFRENFNLEHDIQTLFAQAAITPELNVQAEFRRRRTEEGDVRLQFDANQFDLDRHRDLDQDTGRVGVKFSPSPGSDLIGSLIYSNKNTKIEQSRTSFGLPLHFDTRVRQRSLQGEAQYLFRHPHFNTTVGMSSSSIDWRLRNLTVLPSLAFALPATHDDDTITMNTGYIYSYINAPDTALWTLGFSYDNYSQEGIDISEVNPKLGLNWAISDDVQLRGAAFQVVKPPLIANQTIQPTTIAGFNQFYDDVNGTKAWQYGFGIDTRLTESVHAGTEVSWRDLDVISGTNTQDWDENLYRAYLYWALDTTWVLHVELLLDVFDKERQGDTDRPTQVETVSAPLTMLYLSPLGFRGTRHDFSSSRS